MPKYSIGSLMFVITVVFNSCGYLSFMKAYNLMKEGTVRPYTFKKEISFKEVRGKILVSVSLNGKVYDFLFDTGAVTTLDEQVAEDIKLKTGAAAFCPLSEFAFRNIINHCIPAISEEYSS